MQIPATLVKKVVRCFGPEGESWLERLPHLYEACLSKWRLTNIQISSVISFNYVCFATSPDYGEVALKIGVPHNELFTEITALNIYEGRSICKCFAYDLELGAMLLERIKPGRDLTSLLSSDERLQAASRLVAQLPVPLQRGHVLPLWSDLAQRTFGKLRVQNSAGPQMTALVNLAEEMIQQLENSGRPLVLLHGDLNHWNILLDQDGQWKAIDPKGQVGVAAMETSRFILNELDISAPTAPAQLLSHMTEAFAKELKEPQHIIAQCAFLDKALSTSWKFEEHQKRDLTADVEECKFYLDFYERIKGDQDPIS